MWKVENDERKDDRRASSGQIRKEDHDRVSPAPPRMSVCYLICISLPEKTDALNPEWLEPHSATANSFKRPFFHGETRTANHLIHCPVRR